MIYITVDGKITSHNVLVETETDIYIDRLDFQGNIFSIKKDEFEKNGIYETFEAAKAGQIKRLEELQVTLAKDLESLKKQEKPVTGCLVDKIEEVKEKN